MFKTIEIDRNNLTIMGKLFSGNRMFIDTNESNSLIQQYFKDYQNDWYQESR